MKKIERTAVVEKSNRQWAWQFLRRNRSYQESHAFLGSLSDEQQKTFHELVCGSLKPYSENWARLKLLPLKLLQGAYLWQCEGQHETLGDLVETITHASESSEIKRQSFNDEIDGLYLRVEPSFRAGHYGLYHWIDPDLSEVSDEQAEKLWFYQVPFEATLLRMPSMDGDKFDFSEPEWLGASVDNHVDVSAGGKFKKLSEKNNANSVQQHHSLPLKKGSNGAVFLINNFTNLATLEKPDGSRIFIGPEPDALSLQGDSVVRFEIDVELPIEYQLEAIKPFLLSHQKTLRDAGLIATLPSRKSRQGVFASYIEILDLHELGSSHLEIAKRRKSLVDETYTDAQGKAQKNYVDKKNPDRSTSQEHTSGIRKQLERARYLRDYGYRSLALQVD